VGCIVALAATGISAQFRFDSWTTDNGLPQVSINSILQTRDGFLWFTTYGGLVRYDGLRFEVFNTGNTQGLRTGRFRTMFEDREGTLWICTEGQGVTQYRKGKFTSYTTDDGLGDNTIEQISEDANGTLIFQALDGETQRTNERFSPYPAPPGEPTRGIFHRTAGGAIWYWENGRLKKYENGRVTLDFAPGFNVRRVYEDSQGRAWLGGNGTALSMLKDNRLTNYAEKDGYPPFVLNTVFEDRQNRLWVGTRGGGLLRFQDGKFTPFTTKDGLVGDDVGWIYRDREGTFWIGTTGGLSRMTERAITPYSTANGLASDNVYPIYQDRAGKIWIGSWRGLTVYDHGVFSNVGKQYGVADVLVTSLLEDREGALWIGSWSEGVRRVKDGKITLFPPTAAPGVLVRSIIQDRAGNIWFGTAGGLVKYRDGAFTTYTAKDGMMAKEIFVLYEDRQGQIWIGADNGLSVFQDGGFRMFGEADGIARNIVRSVYEDADGMMWIGMYDLGIYRIQPGKVTHYTTNEGLFDNGAFKIMEDALGNFWISCNLGVYRVKRSELNDLAESRIRKITSIPYNRRDGMLSSECNGGGGPAGIKAQDGRLWFPTQKGVAVIDPGAVPFNRQAPPVVIETFVVDTNPLPASPALQLQPGQTNLEIHYSGLSFINPELVKFKYKLEGIDADWIDAATRRIAFYSHLPPGTFRFTVLAANRDGVWNEVGASVTITVLPPFWRTWWFIGLMVLGVGGLAFTFYWRRTTQLERERAAQQAFSQQLIESQEHERKRIAAELHDGLGQNLMLIKNWALLGLNGLDEGAQTKTELDAISKSASRAIDEAREIAYDLRPFHLDTVGLTKSLVEMVEKVGKLSAIRFRTDIAPLDGLFSNEAEINLYRIVQECLNNIVKHAQAREAIIKIERNTSNVLITISDDGKGMSEPADGTVVKRTGFGLKGLAERVNMLGGKYLIESGPGRGTIVSVHLDLEQALDLRAPSE
jgi:signal transduction histidine kinase/ligand-binding sensor domain-containing protein